MEVIQHFVDRVLEEVGNYPVIIFGSALHGSGRSTLADLTYKRFVSAGIPSARISTGGIFREVAQSEGLTIEEFMELQRKDPRRFYALNTSVDQIIHEEMEEKSLERAVIIDSNLAAYHAEIPNAYALLVYTRPETIAQRLINVKREAEKTYRREDEIIADLVARTRADIDVYRQISEISRDNFWKMVYRMAAKDMEKNLEAVLSDRKPESPFFHTTIDNNGSLEESWEQILDFISNQR